MTAMQIHADLIANEALLAMEFHPPLRNAHEAYAVILEELEEFWEQVKINPRKLSEAEHTTRLEQMRIELTQTAAMCLRALVDLEL